MKPGTLVSTRHGAWFTMLCALAPVVLMANIAALTLHVRFGFGYLPGLKGLPTAWPNWALAGSMLFSVFAITRLLVVVIHHRDFGLSLRSSFIYLFIYFASWAALAVAGALAPSGWLDWFMD